MGIVNENNDLLKQFFTEWYIKWGDREVGFEDACKINQRNEYMKIPPIRALREEYEYLIKPKKGYYTITPKAIKLITGDI